MIVICRQKIWKLLRSEKSASVKRVKSVCGWAGGDAGAGEEGRHFQWHQPKTSARVRDGHVGRRKQGCLCFHTPNPCACEV
eukprot:354510-Chlamydomonas_euryale.AAC.1